MIERTSSDWHRIGGERYEALADQHGTPFYLYDVAVVRSRIEQVRAAFDGEVSVYYAVKANPNLALLEAVRDVADGLDISSGGELEQAVAAGYDGARLSFAGPAKSRDELERSVRHGVANISVESARELDDCIAIARKTGQRAQVVLRVNPKHVNRGYGLKMGGRPVQFGVDEEDIAGVARTLVEHRDVIDFHGLHVYAGSQGFDADDIATGVRDTLRIVRDVESTYGLVCRTVNLGGGFGVSHKDRGVELDVAALADALLPDIRAFRRERERKVVFELGRYLTAEAGLYVTRVLSSKHSRGKTFFMVDGGLHHHLSAAGTFGTALRSNFVLANLTRSDAPSVKCNIAGPSCNPTDLLGVGVEIAQPEHGDLLGVFSSGSYGLTASPLLFLGRRSPPELLLRPDGAIDLARRAFDMQDFN